MSRLTIEKGQVIAEQNIKRLYRIPKRYTALTYYLTRYEGSLRNTLLSVLNYIKDKQLIIDQHRYEFIISTINLTVVVRRKAPQATATTNRHMNLLCALGLLKKVYQSRDKDILIELNRNFLDENPETRRPINVYAIVPYTDKNLDKIEERAVRLRDARITSGNISFVQLTENRLPDIASEIYYANSKSAPEKKRSEAQVMFDVMDMLTAAEGYFTRQMIYDNLSGSMPDREIDKLFKIYRTKIAELYKYAPPNAEQQEKWSLPNRKYIYTTKRVKEKNEDKTWEN